MAKIIRDYSKSSLFTLTIILTFIFITAFLWPEYQPFHTHEPYLALHMGMESFAIVIAFLVFAIGWNTFKNDKPINFILLSVVFFSAGLIDFFHTISYPGMPIFFTENDMHKSLIFWLSARLIVAVGLLTVVLLPWKELNKDFSKYHFLLVAMVVVLFIVITAIFNPTAIPPLFIKDQGLTPIKIWVEYFIFSIHVITAVLLLRSKQQVGIDFTWLAFAVWIMGLAELFFTLYSTTHDIYNIMGHLYKAIAYAMIFRAIFVANVEAPYKELEEKSIEKLYLTQYAVDHSGDLVYWIDTSGKITSVNASALDRLGYEEKELIGTHIGKVEVTLLPRKWDVFLNKLKQNSRLISEGIHFSKVGEEFPSEIKASLFKFNGESFVCAFIRDITDRKYQNELISSSEQRLNKAQHIARLGSWEFDINQNILIWSDEIFNIFEIDSKRFQASYEAFLDLIHPDDRNEVHDAYQRSLVDKVPYEIEHRLLMKDGRIKIVIERGETIYDSDGNPTVSTGTVQDVTDYKKLENQAFHDSLTGLYNRRYFDVTIDRELNRTLGRGRTLVLAICDIDYFKNVNDSFGHDFGDQVLKTLGHYFTEKIRGADFVCRYGGEEFVLVFPETNIANIYSRIEEVRQEVNELQHMTKKNQNVSISISIGIAEAPNHGKTVEEIFKAADKELYKAKNNGRNQVSFKKS